MISIHPRPTRRLTLLSFVVFMVLALPLVLSAFAAARTPQGRDFFEYDSTTSVDQGSGAYEGYTETTQAHYRYTVESVSDGNVTVLGTGSWTYQNSTDGCCQTGNEAYHPVFSLTTRLYAPGTSDVNTTIPNPAVWFWIPTNVSVGQVIDVLDEALTVTSLSSTVWLGAVPHSTVELRGSGQYYRNDAYGQFTATYQDTYHFDAATGYFVSEDYSETDVGTWEGYAAQFHLGARITVTATSYAIPLDLLSFLLLYVGIPAAIVLVIVGIIRVRRGPSKLNVGSKEFPVEVRIRKAKTPADVTNLVPDGSPFFGPFLPVFAERSIAEGDPVVLALADRTVKGMSLLDRESGMGSLFATDDAVAKVLMKRVQMRDFFADATIPGRILGAREMDRFTIYQLQNPKAMDYDTSLVRPMAAQDLPAVIAISEGVYRGRARRFITSSFEAGDLGFVAVSSGRIVGFGFAMVVGSVARLHTLTVDAPYRAQGIGTQIMNARLSTLAALGVERVILEISRQNVASIRVATRAGFAPVGETIYYSRAPQAAPIALQRQT